MELHTIGIDGSSPRAAKTPSWFALFALFPLFTTNSTVAPRESAEFPRRFQRSIDRKRLYSTPSPDREGS